ncbi:hypothetical protein ACIU1J_01600 [Azospirillum doebereinerae]|uniref:hypothetical protein n=1 Tax=Azospirillum doebereinerae TaxID=92933 RepID=UPI00384CF327
MPNLLAKGRLARWSGVAGASLVTLTTMAGTVLAAAAEHAPDAAHGGEHASGGLPQLNPANFPTQIFWLALTFGVLYYLLSKKKRFRAWPRFWRRARSAFRVTSPRPRN